MNPHHDIPDTRMKYILSGLSDILIAVLFLVTWISPRLFSDTMVKSLMLVMVMEFIVIHSGAFLGGVVLSPIPRGKKTMTLLGLGLFYSIFAGAFSLAFGAVWPLAVFWVLLINRILHVLFGRGPDAMEKKIMMQGWAAGIAAYLLAVFATIFIPIPRLGITPEVVSMQDIPGSGHWVSQPWTVIVSGILYFTLTGLSTMSRHRLFKQAGQHG